MTTAADLLAFDDDVAGSPTEGFKAGASLPIDVHAVFHAARAAHPVMDNHALAERLGSVAHDSATAILGPPGMSVLSYAAADHVLRSAETFSSSAHGQIFGSVIGRTVIEMDAPDHRLARRTLQDPFSREAMPGWNDRLVTPIIEHYIDELRGRDRFDIVSDLALPFPVHVTGSMLGLPAEDLPLFHRRAVEVIDGSFRPDRAARAAAALRAYFAQIIAQRRVEPADDLISVLLSSDGYQMTEEEIVAFLLLLLPAGAETTFRLSGTLFAGLLTDREQWELVRADRTLVPRAVEEALRWESPTGVTSRIATTETVVEGTEIPVGTMLKIWLGAANRDPDRWDQPDAFDVRREPLPHVAFGAGPHLCLGIHLARLEVAVLLNTMMDRYPDLELDPAVATPRGEGLMFRGFPNVIVRAGDPS